MKSHDIILINPPYSTISNPYISLPVLDAFLKRENIDVYSCDLDPLLYKELSRPGSVRNGIEHVKRRFVELNAKNNLSFAEAVEYKMFSILLLQLSSHGSHLTDFVQSDYVFEDFKRVPFKKILISAASALSFPEMIVTSPQFAVNPVYESNSVSEIMASLLADNTTTDLMYRTLDSLFKKHDSLLWGISVPFQSQIIKAFQCAAYIKKKRPDAFIILGGPSIAFYFRNIPDGRLFSVVDAFAYYEGELTLKALVGVIHDHGSLHDVPGIAFLENERVTFTEPPQSIHINDSVPPDYNAVDLNDYLNVRENITASVRLTKGCAWGRCTFCSSYNSCYQQIDRVKALEQLISMQKQTGIRNYMFSDEASPLDILDYLAEKIIEHDMGISWIFHTRLSRNLTGERCELYRKAGCRQICVGLESISDEVLHKMNKGITFEQINNFFDNSDPVIPIVAYMMVGFPGETEGDAQKGYAYLQNLVKEKKLGSFVYSHFVIKPGSAVWEAPENFGISRVRLNSERDLDHNIYDFISEGMSLRKTYDCFSVFSGKKNLEQIYAKMSVITFQDINEPLFFEMKDITEFVDSDVSFLYKPMREWLAASRSISRSKRIYW